MTAASSLVLGLGNPLADADGFGPAVIDCLRASGGLPPEVELVNVHDDLIGHIDRFAGRGHVVLVDAVLAAGGTGIAAFGEEDFAGWESRSTGVHAMSALMAVKLFRKLQPPCADPLRQPRITLVAYLVDEADFSRPPGPDVIRAGAEAVRSLLRQP